MGGMKTGTPPRDGRTLDYSKMEVQPSDIDPSHFSFSRKRLSDQLPCHIYILTKLFTSNKVGFDRSPMFNGRIRGLGLGTALLLKIKSTVLRTKAGANFSLVKVVHQIYVNGFSTTSWEYH